MFFCFFFVRTGNPSIPCLRLSKKSPKEAFQKSQKEVFQKVSKRGFPKSLKERLSKKSQKGRSFRFRLDSWLATLYFLLWDPSSIVILNIRWSSRRKLEICRNYCFDAESSFTNVPLDDVVDFLTRDLSPSHQIRTVANCLMERFRFSVTNKVFTFISKLKVSRWNVA